MQHHISCSPASVLHSIISDACDSYAIVGSYASVSLPMIGAAIALVIKSVIPLLRYVIDPVCCSISAEYQHDAKVLNNCHGL